MVDREKLKKRISSVKFASSDRSSWYCLFSIQAIQIIKRLLVMIRPE
ncbi:hypothetical protein SD304_13890 [Staphylococcus nepalensis]|nr:hypothetical protein [Staphylococcus nepalensis]